MGEKKNCCVCMKRRNWGRNERKEEVMLRGAEETGD